METKNLQKRKKIKPKNTQKNAHARALLSHKEIVRLLSHVLKVAVSLLCCLSSCHLQLVILMTPPVRASGITIIQREETKIQCGG
uniref:Uncharacterized protein n=1 Tax=Anguilla anguilla TaxID=7936 RepID=A0A0E9SS81_ANGAN